LMKHLTTPPDLSKCPADFRRVLSRALSKNPAHRYATMAEMARDVAAIDNAPVPVERVPPIPVSVLLESPPVNAQPAGPLPVVLPATVATRTRVAELAGSMALSAVLALLLCIVWAAVLRTNDLTKMAPYFFLTLACTWAVLVPAKLWTTRVEDSWRRRVT